MDAGCQHCKVTPLEAWRPLQRQHVKDKCHTLLEVATGGRGCFCTSRAVCHCNHHLLQIQRMTGICFSGCHAKPQSSQLFGSAYHLPPLHVSSRSTRLCLCVTWLSSGTFAGRGLRATATWPSSEISTNRIHSHARLNETLARLRMTCRESNNISFALATMPGRRAQAAETAEVLNLASALKAHAGLPPSACAGSQSD